MANLNINQFQMVAIRGQQDLQIAQTGSLSCIVSPNQATPLKAGDYVKIDATVTTAGNFPNVVAAADTVVGLVFVVIHSVQHDSYSAGDVIQCAPLINGPVVFETAAATIAPGAAVEDTGSSTVQTQASNKLRGYALDPGVTGQLLRVLGYSQLT